MITDRKEVTKILKYNRKRFECPEFMFAEDSGLDKYKNERIKVLVLFLSNGRYRSSSNTFNILQDIIHKTDNVFVDYCYFLHPDDLKLYDSLDIPYIRGARSGFLINDFDIVLVSVAVLKEIINLPVIFLHDNIPFGYNKRKELNLPILAMGGSSAHVLSIAMGDFTIDNYTDKSLVDIANFGKGSNSLTELLEKALEIDNVKLQREKLLDNLGNRWLKPNRLEFVYNNKGYIVNELSKQKVVLDMGTDVTENFNNKIRNLDGSYADRTDLLISSGCNGRGYCSFCLEGASGGCFKEKSIKEIEKDIIKAKINNFSESTGVFSYNANYHSQIEEIATLTTKYYDRSSVLMSRADVYAKNNKYIDICKKLGTIKLSVASEGISDYIRNDFLNKRLSRSELHSAIQNLMSNRILTIKINYILTGKETINDFEEWLEDIKLMLEYKKNKGYKTRLALTITNLVIYDFTPVRYEKRLMSIHAINYLQDDFINTFVDYTKKISALGVGVNIYGTNMVSAFEQLILDLGYVGTDILIKSVVYDKLQYNKEITKNMCDKFIKRVSDKYDINELFDEREPDTWFASDLVEYHNRKNTKGVQASYKDTSCENCINS